MTVHALSISPNALQDGKQLRQRKERQQPREQEEADEQHPEQTEDQKKGSTQQQQHPHQRHDPNDRTSTPTASDTMRSAAAGLSAHLLYQVSARVFSFVIKAIVVRALKPSQFAFVEIRVVLLVTLALLPAISGFRPVALRVDTEERASALAMFCTLLTVVLGMVLGLGAMILDPANRLSLSIVLLSVIIRAFSELPVIFARRRSLYVQTSRSRGISIIISGISQTLAVSINKKEEYAAPASSIGHVAYVLALGISMYSALGNQGLPKSLTFSGMRDNLRREDLAMAAVATGEGFIKFLLENGEAIVLDVCTAPEIKGAYKIAANLGSVFARLFSEALEEQAFNVFTRLSDAFRPQASSDQSDAIPSSGNEENLRRVDRQRACLDMLTLGLKAALSVSLVFAIIGPSFAYALLRLLYGSIWADATSAPAILSSYLIYVVFMAGNGVSEAFVTASASTTELKARTRFTTMLSVVYMLALYTAASMYGAIGVIAVNCGNMACRTVYSIWFFTRFTRHPLRTLTKSLPHAGVVGTLLIARVIASRSERLILGPATHRIVFNGQLDMLKRVASHALSGVLALLMFSAATWVFERDFIKRIRSLRSHQD